MMTVLLDRVGLKHLYVDSFKGLKVLCFQLEQFISAYMPELYFRFQEVGVQTVYFALQWMVTLFTLDLSIDISPLAFDLFLLDGWKSLVKLSLAALSFSQ